MTTANKKAAPKDSGKPEDGRSFEKSLERLEKIVAEMEAGTMGLEDMIGRFEEGQNLITFCSRKLNEVQRKIEVLVKKGEKIETEPFVPGEGEASDSPDGEAKSEDLEGNEPF